MKFVVTQAGPGAGFSTGALQPGGAGKFATIADLQGPFSITMNYTAAGSSNRYPQIYIDDEVVTDPAADVSTGTSDPKTYTYNYTGTDAVTVTFYSAGNAIRLYDLIITLAAEED